MNKKRLQLVLQKGESLVSELSPEEQGRALALGDIALHNPAPNNPMRAGERAKMDHRNLMEQLERAAKRARRLNRAA